MVEEKRSAPLEHGERVLNGIQREALHGAGVDRTTLAVVIAFFIACIAAMATVQIVQALSNPTVGIQIQHHVCVVDGPDDLVCRPMREDELERGLKGLPQ